MQKPNQILIQERQTKREEINMLGLDKMFIDHLEKNTVKSHYISVQLCSNHH